jgi:hypothetical protein
LFGALDFSAEVADERQTLGVDELHGHPPVPDDDGPTICIAGVPGQERESACELWPWAGPGPLRWKLSPFAEVDEECGR